MYSNLRWKSFSVEKYAFHYKRISQRHLMRRGIWCCYEDSPDMTSRERSTYQVDPSYQLSPGISLLMVSLLKSIKTRKALNDFYLALTISTLYQWSDKEHSQINGKHMQIWGNISQKLRWSVPGSWSLLPYNYCASIGVSL